MEATAVKKDECDKKVDGGLCDIGESIKDLKKQLSRIELMLGIITPKGNPGGQPQQPMYPQSMYPQSMYPQSMYPQPMYPQPMYPQRQPMCPQNGYPQQPQQPMTGDQQQPQQQPQQSTSGWSEASNNNAAAGPNPR